MLPGGAPPIPLSISGGSRASIKVTTDGCRNVFNLICEGITFDNIIQIFVNLHLYNSLYKI